MALRRRNQQDSPKEEEKSKYVRRIKELEGGNSDKAQTRTVRHFACWDAVMSVFAPRVGFSRRTVRRTLVNGRQQDDVIILRVDTAVGLAGIADGFINRERRREIHFLV